MKKMKVIFFVGLVFNCVLMAQQNNVTIQEEPWPAPLSSDNVFIINQGEALDNFFGHEKGSPLTIELDINRLLGTRDDIDKQIKNGFLLPKATLEISAKDVDYNEGEVDEVYFNGKHIGTLNGANDKWSKNTFIVDISSIIFPNITSDEKGNVAKNLGKNKFEIYIDVKKSGWVTCIDWVSVTIQAVNPTIFVYGLNSHKTSANSDLADLFMEMSGIPCHKVKINSQLFTRGNQSSDFNSSLQNAMLQSEERKFKQMLGVNQANIIIVD